MNRRRDRNRVKNRNRQRAKGCLMGILVYTAVVTAALFLMIVLYGREILAEAGKKEEEEQFLETDIAKEQLTGGKEEVLLAEVQGEEPIDFDAWNMILVNPWNPVPENYQIELAEAEQGYQVDARIAENLRKMLEDARAEGFSPRICSAYRSHEKQIRLYNNKVKQYLKEGCSTAEAKEKAGKWVAAPGTSEHETGLAVDLVASSYQILDEKQEETEEQKWLMENSYKYGFILRYPNEKSERTGIYYEPWHYRYVGEKAAKEIYEQNMCLEEYLAQEI